jgi:formate dehydrogenase major subunit
MVWNFPDPIPQHREPLYSTRPDLVAKYPTHDDKKAFWRLPTLYKSLQQKNVADKVARQVPADPHLGRLVEYEGGGEETRSNPWLAELQQEMFVEINPQDAPRGRSIVNGDRVWLRHAHGCAAERAGDGDRARRARHRLDALPLLRALAGRGHAAHYPNGAAPWCAARRSTPAPPTATTASR